ncbi:gluconate 5-dehydrogenase [Yersinia enterocolitica]|nr:gluconate 5-dehydrogenase [Yersinia enterocolitica]
MARAPRDGFTASLRSACFHHCGHFVNNLRRLFSVFFAFIYRT